MNTRQGTPRCTEEGKHRFDTTTKMSKKAESRHTKMMRHRLGPEILEIYAVKETMDGKIWETYRHGSQIGLDEATATLHAVHGTVAAVGELEDGQRLRD